MIGIFDSGSGGLTILAALRKQMPEQDFLYLGDHANAPYGHRSNQQIVDLTRCGVDTLMKKGCRLVILACNTAAAVALRTLQQNWLEDAYPGNRILGVLVPMVEALTGVPWSQKHPLAGDLPRKNIMLFATRKTVESGAYAEEVQKRAPHLHLLTKPCPGLVDAIEGGAGEQPLSGLVTGYVNEACTSIPDAVVLGCTHFPLVRHLFEAALPANTVIMSQPDIVAASLKDYLIRRSRYAEGPAKPEASPFGRVCLLTTGNPAEISALSALLPENLGNFTSV